MTTLLFNCSITRSTTGRSAPGTGYCSSSAAWSGASGGASRYDNANLFLERGPENSKRIVRYEKARPRATSCDRSPPRLPLREGSSYKSSQLRRASAPPQIRLQELAKGKKRSLTRQVWEELIDFVQAFKVRKTPSWPRSWANFSLL